MNAELKQKWLDALRSGKYLQAQKALRVGDGFCCLGVLCDVSGEGHWFEEMPGLWGYLIGSGDDEWSVETEAPNYLVPDEDQTPLVRMNDEKGASFHDIADYIEKNL